MRNFHISVTREDIRMGVEANCLLCPIARAVRRAIGRSDVSVAKWAMTDLNAEGDFNIRAVLPPNAISFIDLFDDGQSVQPMEFDLTFDADVEPWEEY